MDRAVRIECINNMFSEFVRHFAPNLYRHTATLGFRKKAVREVLLLARSRLAARTDKFFFYLRYYHIRKRPGDACVCRVAEPETFYFVENLWKTVETVVRDKLLHETTHALVRYLFVDEWEVRR